jgi:hypothetical protein
LRESAKERAKGATAFQETMTALQVSIARYCMTDHGADRRTANGRCCIAIALAQLVTDKTTCAGADKRAAAR